jgi:hypothetical protein
VNSKEDEVEKRKILDLYLLCASIRNSMGFLITSSSEDPEYASLLSIAPTEYSLEKFTKACKNDLFLDTMQKLRAFYAQVDKRSKIILGVSLLEYLFYISENSFRESKRAKYAVNTWNGNERRGRGDEVFRALLKNKKAGSM